MTADASAIRQALLRQPQRELPFHLLYDDLGSALFDAITHLPEYGLTRADERVVVRAAAAIAERFPLRWDVAELGSGSGRKTGQFLRSLKEAFSGLYLPIDISRAALDRCRVELHDIALVRPIEANYLDGLARLADLEREQPLLMLFLGSSVGNFAPADSAGFFCRIRAALRPGDGLLVGADLMRDPSRLIPAYDDPLGVTAAFNRNLLARLNRDYGANFDVRGFQHEARYNAECHRVEMHLRSDSAHAVEIPGLELQLTFAEGETIWTESSYKFAPDALCALAAPCGFESVARWIDEEWPFAECFWRAV